jgi:acetolactate synthase-1/2/3 large subunit
VTEIAKILAKGEEVVLLVGGRGFRAEGLRHAAAVGARTGVRVLGDRVNSRMERGAGRYDLIRIPYPVPQAIALLEGTKHMVLAGATIPVGFFGYPDQPSRSAPPDCEYHVLAESDEDVIGALSMLAEEISATPDPTRAGRYDPPPLPTGDISIEKVWAAVAHLMPEDTIVSDEAVTSGRSSQGQTAGARPHDWLNITGGSIGQGLPAALGAAIACPDRQVFAMESDGSAMYTLQGLWSMAREQCQVLTIMFNNGAYRILQGELERLAPDATGQTSKAMLDLTRPDIDWVSLSQGMGVEASRANSCEELVDQMRSALTNRGPRFIEVLV